MAAILRDEPKKRHVAAQETELGDDKGKNVERSDTAKQMSPNPE